MTYRINKTKNYSVISNLFLNDESLSWKAKGVLAYLLTKPDNWEIKITDLKNRGTDGKEAIYSAIKELKARGYIVGKRYSDGSYEYIIYEVPPKGEPDSGDPYPGEPNQENPDVLVNTENITNTDIPDSHESGEDVTPKDRTPSVKTKGDKKQRTPEYKELFRRLDEMFRKGYHCWSEGKPYPTSAKENTMLSTICSRYEQSPAVVEDMVRKYYKKLMNREQYWDHCAFLPSGFVKNEQRIIALDAGLSGGDRLRYQNGDLSVVEKTEL